MRKKEGGRERERKRETKNRKQGGRDEEGAEKGERERKRSLLSIYQFSHTSYCRLFEEVLRSCLNKQKVSE